MKLRTFLVVALFSLLPLTAFAQQGISQLNQWKTNGKLYLQPISASYGLLVPGLATSTTGCLAVNSIGWISANGLACGSGSGGGSFPFSADTNYNQVVYSTSTPTLWLKSGLFASSTSYLVY